MAVSQRQAAPAVAGQPRRTGSEANQAHSRDTDRPIRLPQHAGNQAGELREPAEKRKEHLGSAAPAYARPLKKLVAGAEYRVPELARFLLEAKKALVFFCEFGGGFCARKAPVTITRSICEGMSYRD
jgi:hypothetical protein